MAKNKLELELEDCWHYEEVPVKVFGITIWYRWKKVYSLAGMLKKIGVK